MTDLALKAELIAHINYLVARRDGRPAVSGPWGLEPAWAEHERTYMLEVANQFRTGLGLSDVTIEQIHRAEHDAATRLVPGDGYEEDFAWRLAALILEDVDA